MLLTPIAASIGLTVALAAVAGAAAVKSQAEPAARAARTSLTQTALIVPKGSEATPFNTARKLALPSGWGGEVWARVSDARFAVWTPQGQLLVSSSSAGKR